MVDFFECIKKGDLNLLLNNNSFDLNSKDSSSRSAIYYACLYNHFEILNYLIINNANLNITDKDGETPLFEACRKNKFLAIKLLVDNGASISIKNKKGETPLHYACKNNDVDVLKYLISMDSDVLNIFDSSYKTPLHYAVLSGNINNVKYIIDELNFNINVLDFAKNSLMHYAAYQANTDMIIYFIEKGLDINQLNDQFETPFFYAVKIGMKNCVKIFLDNFIYIEIKNKRFETIFHVLDNSGEIYEMISDFEKSARYSSYIKKNKLQLLILNRDFSSIKEFCSNKELVGYDFFNKSPLFYAKKYKFNSIVELIKRTYPVLI